MGAMLGVRQRRRLVCLRHWQRHTIPCTTRLATHRKTSLAPCFCFPLGVLACAYRCIVRAGFRIQKPADSRACFIRLSPRFPRPKKPSMLEPLVSFDSQVGYSMLLLASASLHRMHINKPNVLRQFQPAKVKLLLWKQPLAQQLTAVPLLTRSS